MRAGFHSPAASVASAAILRCTNTLAEQMVLSAALYRASLQGRYARSMHQSCRRSGA